MSKFKRYSMSASGFLRRDDNGDYVEHSDVAAIEARLEWAECLAELKEDPKNRFYAETDDGTWIVSKSEGRDLDQTIAYWDGKWHDAPAEVREKIREALAK